MELFIKILFGSCKNQQTSEYDIHGMQRRDKPGIFIFTPFTSYDEGNFWN